MEYVEGIPLDKFCDQRKLDLEGRVKIFIQVSDAVCYLHEHLVVHRDLKQSNILVTGEGVVKLLDFGIAKQRIPTADAGLTGVQHRIMTPSYASPEQFSGSPVTKASDIYTLGVILYQLLTGSLPHASPAEKLTTEPSAPSSRIREDLQRTPETTSELRRRIVGDLDHVVLMCLRRDPRNRYASASDLSADLHCFLESRPVAARRGPMIERAIRFVKRNRVAVTISVVILFLAGFGAWKTAEAQTQQKRIDALARLLDADEKRAAASVPPAAWAADVRKLREAIKRNTASDGSQLTTQRQSLLARGMKYLDKLKAFASQDPVLATELAGAYKALGSILEATSPTMAQNAYDGAAMVLNNVPAGEPARIAAPNKTPKTLSEPRRYAHIVNPDFGNPSPAPDNLTAEPFPPPLAAPLPPPPPELERLMDTVKGKARTAEEMYNFQNANLQRQGLILHPNIVEDYNRMELAIESANRSTAAGNFDAANEQLDIAKAHADRVMKTFGR
jgi:hypothetical protein